MSGQLPILGFCAYSGTGKTTLLTSLLPLLKAQDIRVGIIKHAHHKFDLDQPGKDSYELRKAGAKQVLVSSSRRWAMVTELFDKGEDEAGLDELISRLDHANLDLILVEGFKNETFPKIELHRPELDKPTLYQDDDDIIAFATNGAPPADITIPVLRLDSPGQVFKFICNFINSSSPNT